jgi:hypothetical protein
MGFSITWCAIPEKNGDQFIKTLSLTPTGKTEEIPESLDVMAKLDTGWRVIWHNKYGCPYLKPKDLGKLSIDQEVILCLVEEHVMASSAEFWSKGNRQWWISHEGENGPKGLELDGDPPDIYPAIRKEMEQQQLDKSGDAAGVDYVFEIPIKVAQSLVGFKHDDDYPHVVGGRFEVMTRVAPTANPLSRLFSRK